ncbi:T6SS effector BTH_I2691 family protein [Variovorax sp. LT1R20]|uniref:T6SS effector BTH_I2691 family protein n=1 Tax=Variovorax sp. LT1R20 TaxID=3443729 RepID=UPI003F487EC7
MADTTSPTYSAAAQKAAAGTPGCAAGGCPACIKAGLPVLLVRPGLAERKYAKDKQDAARPLLDKHTAEVALTYSSYVMRTLRAGFVVVYYKTPHTPQLISDEGWQIFRVSDGGYLSPFPLHAVPYTNSTSHDDGFVCQRSDAYANAMLLVIPEAQYAGSVWVGYSDHPWSKPVRDLYASSEELRLKRMTLIEASQGKAERAMPLTEKAILELVADYDKKRQPNDLLGTPFPPLSLHKVAPGKAGVRPETARQVIQAAQRLVAASEGQYAMSHVHMVSVPDAVGVTSESAYMRLTQCNSAASWIGKQKNGEWLLQSALAIEGLLKEIDARGDSAKQHMQDVAYLNGKPITKAEFQRQQEAGKFPPQARWEPNRRESPVPRAGSYPDFSGGRIVLPSEGEIDDGTADLKTRVLNKLASNGRTNYPFRKFLQEFERLSKADKYLLAQIEPDHGMWLQSDARKLVTENDFGPKERIDGLHYAHVVAQITLGGHMSITGLEWYKALVSDSPYDSQALLTRAMLGNQVDFFDVFKSTKIHKETKNIFKLFEETREAFVNTGRGVIAAPLASQQWLAKYPFYNTAIASIPALKNAAALVASPLIGIAGAVVMARKGTDPLSSAIREEYKALMCDIIEATGLNGTKAHAVKMRLSEAVSYWESVRAEIARNAAGEASRAGNAVVGRLRKSFQAGGLSLALAGHFRGIDMIIDVWVFTNESPEKLSQLAAAAGRTAAGTTTARAIGWTAAQLTTLARGSAVAMSGGTAAFSLAGAMLHGLSLKKSAEMLEHGSQEQRRAAWFGLANSGLGVVGAMAEVSEQVLKESGEMLNTALKDSGRHWVDRANRAKLLASRLSALGLFVDAGFAAVNACARFEKNDTDSGTAYLASGVLFGMAGWAGLMAAAQVGAEAAAVSAGTASVASTGLLGLSWTGWGLILIGLAVSVGYIAVLLKDTPTEEWVAKTIWRGAASKPFFSLDSAEWGSFEVEQQELNKLLMGIRVEFDYSMGVQDTMSTYGRNLTQEAIIRGSPFGGAAKDPIKEEIGVFKSIDLRLWMPQTLRDNLEWSIDITLDNPGGGSTSVYVLGRGYVYSSTKDLGGVADPKLTEEKKNGFTHLEIPVDAVRYPGAQARVVVRADALSQDYVINEVIRSP